MNCPYCAEEINDAAIACKHCGRDLFIIRPLLEKLDQATNRLKALEAGPAVEPAAAASNAKRPPTDVLPAITPVSAMTLTFILLVVAHFIIIVDHNLPLIFLRIVSILAPLAFGFLCRESDDRALLKGFAYGLVVAAASVLAMSAIVGKVDNVPALPRNGYEWREFAEYGASIAFGFFTGVIVRQAVIAMRSAASTLSRPLAMVSRVIAKRLGGKIGGVDARKVESIARTAVAIASGIVSITTGLKQFF